MLLLEGYVLGDNKYLKHVLLVYAWEGCVFKVSHNLGLYSAWGMCHRPEDF